jgi:hypothetical protein
MVRTSQNSWLTILNVLCPFQLCYNMPSMAELANPLYWGARAIGFDAFWHLAAVLDGARVVLVTEFCRANPLASCKLCCMRRIMHELVD